MNDTPHHDTAVSTAEIAREYGPFETSSGIAGVTHDGTHVWAATGERLIAIDPASGDIGRSLSHPADAGTAFDGTHLYQLAEARIDKIDPATGAVVASIPAPGLGGDSGMAWADGSLWVGQYRDRRIVQIDPATGAVLRTIASDRFVTGVSWVDGELWHGTWEGDDSDLRRIDPPRWSRAGTPRAARRRACQRPGVRRRRPLLLRRRPQRPGACRASSRTHRLITRYFAIPFFDRIPDVPWHRYGRRVPASPAFPTTWSPR